MIFFTLVVQGYVFVTSSTLTNVIGDNSFNWDIPGTTFFSHTDPADIYLLQVNNRNTRTRYEIC